MNSGNGQQPKTLMEAVTYFSDLENARLAFEKIRWPHGACCPRCGSTAVRYLPKYRRWQCSSSHPRRQFTVKVGTIMEDSPLGLDKWAVGFWLEVNAKNSVSSYEIHRALGITQKSAWFMLHRIRLATKTGSIDKIGGVGSEGVEADETFIGGKARNMHKKRRERVVTGTGGTHMTPVMGLLGRHSERGKSQVFATVVENRRRETIQAVIRKQVETGTPLYTDAHDAYTNLGPDYFHAFVDHAEKYVDGKVHTNGLENFWSLFKRCIKGTHISIEPFHLMAYLDSECFPFNNREFTDGERFRIALAGMEGKRLTYKALIGALEDAPATGSDKGAANGNGLPN
jgi:transposase-like protein